MKSVSEVKVKVEFTEGYESRITKACLKQLERREKKQQKGPPGNRGQKIDDENIA